MNDESMITGLLLVLQVDNKGEHQVDLPPEQIVELLEWICEKNDGSIPVLEEQDETFHVVHHKRNLLQ